MSAANRFPARCDGCFRRSTSAYLGKSSAFEEMHGQQREKELDGERWTADDEIRYRESLRWLSGRNDEDEWLQGSATRPGALSSGEDFLSALWRVIPRGSDGRCNGLRP